MKYKYLRLLAPVLAYLLYSPLLGQYALDEYCQEGELKYEDHVYKAGIRTVKFHPAGNPQGMPVIKLNGGHRCCSLLTICTKII
ncbi:MAG: hypothetical protein U5L96_03300 [Owenweeksia sp.]|nr:hypothetical protein [Owenweeksia sp.]